MIRFLLATLVLPLAFATHFPLPKKAPKGVPPQAFAMVRRHLEKARQVDLSKLGIPVERSLRLANWVHRGGGVQAFTAVSPKKVETLYAWYQKHLHGWKTIEHDKGALVIFAPKGTTKAEVNTFKRPVLNIARCFQGSYQLFPCGSSVTVYAPAGH